MCRLRVGTVFIYYVPHGISVILYAPHAGLRQHKLLAKKQSKTLTVKNKNKIFPKFLSPFPTTCYKNPASKNSQIFGQKRTPV
jgi:hypothetical protein